MSRSRSRLGLDSGQDPVPDSGPVPGLDTGPDPCQDPIPDPDPGLDPDPGPETGPFPCSDQLTLQPIFSIATPPIEGFIWVYWVTYFGQLSLHFFCCSYFLTLYIKYVFIFQPDAIEGLSIYKLRWKTFFWKILLTFLGMYLSIYFPLQEEPTFFKLLTKGTSGSYKRYSFLSCSDSKFFQMTFS